MVRDRHFRSGSRSELIRCQTGGPGCQHTGIVNSGTIGCKYLIPSRFGRLLAGLPAGLSLDLYNVGVFAVGQLYSIKISYSTANNHFMDVLQSVTWIILESVFCLLSVAVLAIEAVNSSVMSAHMCTKH
jgi:hypothetical protein